MEMNVEKTKVMRIWKQQSLTQITIYKKQPQNVEYFKCSGSTIKNDAIRTRETKPRIDVEKAAFDKKFVSPENWT
jgi:hypothetical protein